MDGDENEEEEYKFVMEKEEKKKNKKVEKLKKKKVDDIINIVERKDMYLEKNTRLNDKLQFTTFATDVTPNKQCEITISAVGLDDAVINYIDSNSEIVKELSETDYKSMSDEIKKKASEFKSGLLSTLVNEKKLKNLIETSLLAFGSNQKKNNILLVRNLPKKFSIFNFENENTDSNEPSEESKAGGKSKKPKIVKNLEEEINVQLKNQISLREFLNAIKSGFDYATGKNLINQKMVLSVKNTYMELYL